MNQPRPLLVYKNENPFFGLALLLSFFITLVVLVSVIGALLFLLFGFVSFLTHALCMAHIQLNGVRVRENQLPVIHNKVTFLCEQMELKRVPEVYVVQSGGVLNAFATKITSVFGKRMVVLYSDLVEATLNSGGLEMDFILAHELAHIKRSHLLKRMLIAPALWIPFIGTSYLRATEYTCDRMAVYYTGMTKSAIDSLLLLASGKRLYTKINLNRYLQQYNDKKGLIATLAELCSIYPPLPKRIHEIQLLMAGDSVVPLKKRNGQTALIWIIMVILLPGLLFLLIFSGYKTYQYFDIGAWFASNWQPPLIQAVSSGDAKTVKQLLKSGEDPNETDDYGEGPLTMAADKEQLDIVKLLLSYGADPNLADNTGWTPLMSSVDTGNLKIGKLLLEAGGDPTQEDQDGWSALDYAKDDKDKPFILLLNQYSMNKYLNKNNQIENLS